jgi:hypothetical protein
LRTASTLLLDVDAIDRKFKVQLSISRGVTALPPPRHGESVGVGPAPNGGVSWLVGGVLIMPFMTVCHDGLSMASIDRKVREQVTA